jgi:hypothetical protein
MEFIVVHAGDDLVQWIAFHPHSVKAEEDSQWRERPIAADSHYDVE